MGEANPRIKVAVLGGGVGALSAAFGLTQQPGWQDRYEITVYQLGWRLGGKGASGRNPDHQQRIEEHGLHIWGGFYDNAFRIMRACYDELKRPHGSPLATLEDAFKPLSHVDFTEFVNGQWKNWPIRFPENGDPVGTGGELPSVWSYITGAIEWLVELVESSPHVQPGVAPSAGAWVPVWIENLVQRVEALAVVEVSMVLARSEVTPDEGAPASLTAYPLGLLRRALHLARTAPADALHHSAGLHHGVLWLLGRFKDWLTDQLRHRLDSDDGARRLWLFADFTVAMITGLIRDGVVFHGFDVIDDQDWNAWLKKNGASQATLDTPQVRGMYDYLFAYDHGDTDRPRVAAGAITRCLLRMTLTYKTAIYMKMQAGMGDTVFAPLYQVLKRRGVKFAFFHRVTNLGLSPDQGMISTLTLARQVTLKGAEYHPLVDVKGLPCWPSCPLYDQIVEGPQLKAQGIDLESAWTTWKDVEEVTLHLGRDFDLVILGISLAALPYCCKELIAARSDWRAMVENLGTISTQAFQFWFHPTAAALGRPDPTIGSGYAQPFDTWCDMTHLLPREQWPANGVPGSLYYLCGPLKDPDVIPPFTEAAYPAQVHAETVQRTAGWIEPSSGFLWPGSAVGGGNPGFNWNLLVDPAGGAGQARLDAQYVRANVNPSDRYVLALPGTTRYRLKAGESGFGNLFLAGDWVRNGLNYGCVESAAMGGLQASRAICGYPRVIPGETD